jgi:hypothetical protein
VPVSGTSGSSPRSRQRQAVIDTNAELRERELIKLASLASTIADTLRVRGVGDQPASLAAEAGITVFKVAFDAGSIPVARVYPSML